MVNYHDPHVPTLQNEGMEKVGVTDLAPVLRLTDWIGITRDHSAYDWPAIRVTASLFVDIHHILPAQKHLYA